ncbi:MAG: galactose mutarotase [Clostridia bacterium]|nr:galactose mutarotase [Clostridia bacterium]
MQIAKRPWGEMDGKNVHIYDIVCGETRLSVSDFGALWQAFVIGDTDFVLGYDTPQEYRQNMTFFGAMIGPIADRLAEGKCVLSGKTVQLEKNAGPDSMHSSNIGFHNRIWDTEIIENGVHFSTLYANDGLPGNIAIDLIYRLMDENTLRIEYAAQTDTETALSFTNHSYFNLDGGKNHCRGHKITVHADHYAETERDEEPIVTGRRLKVDGTPMDLRSGAVLGDVLARSDFPEIRTGGGIDHFFIVRGEGMRPHAEIEGREWKLECRSDAPGVLVYTANGLEEGTGKNGMKHGKNYAICLETERFPNAANIDGMRESVLLRPGEKYLSATEFKFIRK